MHVPALPIPEPTMTADPLVAILQELKAHGCKDDASRSKVLHESAADH